MIIAVGSTNPAKLKAAKLAVNKLFPKAKIIGVNVLSGVSDQPMSDAESICGAVNRARRALSEVERATYGIGMEGGIQLIGKRYFDCGWIAVVNKNGRIGLGSSGRFEVSKKIMRYILEGDELGPIGDDLSGIKDNKRKQGVMGIITNGHLSRATAYSHGILFAFAPFFSDKKFWE